VLKRTREVLDFAFAWDEWVRIHVDGIDARTALSYRMWMEMLYG
jgi:hypothetical protein